MRWQHWFYTLPLRLRSIFRRRHVERELEEELSFHLEQRMRQELAAGKTREEARQSALQAMNGLEQRKEECRDARRVNLVDSVVRDLRYGFRVLRKKPGFFVVATATLGLGIGIATTLFSVVESQLWRPLPFPDSEHLAAIWKHHLKDEWKRGSVSTADFADWRGRARTFQKLGAIQWAEQRNLSAQRVTERIRVASVSADFLETLGAKPMAGRAFQPMEEQPGRGRVAIVSAELAQRIFGSPKNALSGTIKLDGEGLSIVGVLPLGFQLEVMRTPDVLVPLEIEANRYDNQHRAGLEVIGRLRAGIAIEQAQQDMEAIARQIAMEHPKTNQGWSVYAENLRGSVVWPYRTSLLLYFGFACFVLLIACANVAGLQLARAVQRQSAFVVREALGASAAALIRQALLESAWIAMGGGALGVALAGWGMAAIRLLPLDRMLPRPAEVTVNSWAVAFAVCVSLLCTFVFGLAPRLFVSKANVEPALRESTRMVSGSVTTRRRMGALVIAEAALAFLSLFGAGLFVSSHWEIQHVPVGFNPHDVVTMQISLSGRKYSDPGVAATFYRRVANQMSATLGVQAFALSNGCRSVGQAIYY